MAYEASLSVTAGNPTKATDYNRLAVDADWLQAKGDQDHDYDISTGSGKHKTINFVSDSNYDVGTSSVRARVVYADTLGDTGQALAIAATSVTLPSGHAWSWAAGDVTLTHSANQLALAGGTLTAEAITASGVVNISTATNWQLGGVAFTGTMANLNTLRDDSMADALHRHSELSASDGTPNPALQVDAAGQVGIWTTGTIVPASTLDVRANLGGVITAGRVANVAATSEPGYFDTRAPNASGTAKQWTSIAAVVDDPTDATEDAHIDFRTMRAGALTSDMVVGYGASGSVGIGTTEPVSTGKLHLLDSANHNQLKIEASAAGKVAGIFLTTNGAGNVWSIDNRGTSDTPNNRLAIFRDSAEKVTIDTAGNVGIGVMPSGWHTSAVALQMGGNAALAAVLAVGAGSRTYLTNNTNYDTDDSWEYISTDEATRYTQADGYHIWYGAASGTAGTDITWVEGMRLTNAGQLLVGHTASVAVGSREPLLQVHDTAYKNVGLYEWSADAAGPLLHLSKSRSATKGTMTIVQDNDNLGVISAYGADGVDLNIVAGQIVFRVNGTPGVDDIPGEIELATYDGGAQTGSLILDAAGNATLAGTATRFTLDGVGADAFFVADATTNTSGGYTFAEAGASKYYMAYEAANNRWVLNTTDSDGGGTDADVIRIPDGGVNVQGNGNFQDGAFDACCSDPACGWHGEDGVEQCPVCGAPTEWHDDVAAMRVMTRSWREDPEVVQRLEKWQLIDTYGGKEMFVSMNRMPFFLMSGLVQERSLREQEEASLREELALLKGRLVEAESELRLLRG